MPNNFKLNNSAHGSWLMVHGKNKILNPNIEALNKFKCSTIQISKGISESHVLNIRYLYFDIVSDLDIGISCLVLL